jgi:hypothetical protein
MSCMHVCHVCMYACMHVGMYACMHVCLLFGEDGAPTGVADGLNDGEAVGVQDGLNDGKTEGITVGPELGDVVGFADCWLVMVKARYVMVTLELELRGD